MTSTKQPNLEFAKRTIKVLVDGIAFKDQKQVRAAAAALAKEFGVDLPVGFS